MAALRLVRKWGVPLATAAGAPLLMPAVRAESGSDGAKEPPPAPPTSRMVRPSDLPIYEEPEEVLDFEYYGRERSSLEEGVGVVRKEVEGIMEATRSARERIVHIYETGKAHSMATIDYLTDEENMLPRAGAITVGGLAGLVIGARRRGGFIKKAMYTSTGVLTAASLCYPRQAYAVSQQVFGAAKNYGAVGYNFVVGVKPQSKTSPPEEPKEPEKEAETSATSPATEDTPPAPAPTPQPEGAEVRSAVALSLPPGKSLVDTLAEQASDVTVWGFRLTDQEGTASSRATTQDAPPKVPEGFGSISTADIDGESAKVVMGELKGESEDDAPVSQATEEEKKPMDTPVEGEGGSLVEKVVEALKEETTAVEEKVTVVEERVQEIVEEGVIAVAEKVAVVEEKASTAVVEVLTPIIGEKEAEEVVEKVETVVEEAAEKVADLVEEKLAVVVEVAAKEVKEEAAVVEEVMQEVKETGEKVEKALDVAERVTKTVEKAAETYPVIPVAEVKKVEKVIEETEAVVENITEAAKEVEGLAEEVKKEAEKVEKEVTEVMESEEKRKEVLEAVEAKEKQDISAVVEEPADVAPPQLKEAPQEDQKEVDTSPVAHLTPAVPQEREGLFDKLVNFFSKQDKDAIKSPKEEQLSIKATETRETPRDNKSTEISKELEHVKQVEVEAQSHIEGDTHTTQLPDSEGGTGSVHVGEGGSLVEEVVEVVKEEAAVAGEKVTEVKERMVETVKEGVIAVGEEVGVVEEKVSTAAVEVLTPMLGEKEATEVVGKVEMVVGEAVEKVAEMVEGKVAVVVEEAAKEVEEEAAVVKQLVEVVEETGEKVEKALNLVERVTGAVEEAAEKFPAVPVGEIEKVEEVVEGTAVAVESFTEAAKEVKELTEDVRKEAEKVEKVATEVMESEEKRKEVLESIKAKEKLDAGAVVEEPADVPPSQQDQKEDTSVAHFTPSLPQEREGLFDKLVNFFNKQDKDVIESLKEEQPASKFTETRETDSDGKVDDTSEDLESIKQAEVEAQGHIEGETQPPDSEGGAGSVPVGEGGEGNVSIAEGGSLVDEVVEVVKEGAAVAGEVTEVEGRMLEMVKEGVIAVGEKIAVVEEKASTAAVEVLTPMLGEKEATEVVGKVEMVVGEAVEKVAEMVEGKVAVVVEEAAKEVEEEAAVVKQLVEVVEETGEKVEKALNLVERVTGAVEEAAEKFPAVHIGEIEKVEEVVEGTEVAVESFTEAAKEVEELTEDVRKEAEKVEKVATEVMESEEKRKEVLEEVLESVEAKGKLDTGAVVEEPADVPPSQQDQKEVGTSPVAHFTPSLPQEREGLFDKLVSFFSKQDKDTIETLTETAKEVEPTEEVRKEEVKVEEEATEVMESKEKREEVLKEVLESLEIKEEHDTGTVVEDLALVPPPQPEKALQETEVDTPLVTPLTPAISQEREGLFDKLVNFFSKPDKDDIGSTKEYQAEKEVFQSTKEEQIEASVSEVKSDSEHRESITKSTGRSESNTTQTIELEGIEKSESETVEKAEIETTVKHESGIVGEMKEGKMQELVEEKEQIGKVEGEKEQVVEEETGWVMVEMKEEKGKVEETADEKVQSATSDEQYSREVGEIKEEAHGSGVVPTGKEGLFHQLVKLFTKDEAKPLSISDVVVPQESTLGSSAEGAPLLGEGEGKEPSISTLVKEDEVLPVAHGDVLVQENVPVTTSEDTVDVPDVSIVPENTVHAPDVSQLVEDKTLIIDTLTGSDDTAQIPSLPTVPGNIARIADAGQALKDTAHVSKDTAECSDVSAAEPDIVEIVSSKLPQHAQTHEGVVVSTEQVDSEAVREPAGTLGTKKWVTEDTSVHPIEESTPPSPPPPVEKKSIFDKLASLFQEKQQEQLQETATEKVKKPLTEAEEPAVEVKDMPGGTEQETSSFTKESEAATMVLENPQEESSSVAPTEDVHPEPMSQPAMKDSTPTGTAVPETHVSSMGRKEEEEAALAAEAEAAPQQLQVSSPQVQSPTGDVLGPQPSGQVSGEVPESVAAADTQTVSSPHEEGLPATQSLAPQEAAEDQGKSMEPSAEPHIVEAESRAAVPDLAKDTSKPNPEEPSESSQINITSQGDTFTVRANPNKPSGIEAQGEEQQRQAGVTLRPSWLRSEAEVMQEGKDVIVKLEPTAPEKDYGQSNPDDSDMYTTRG